MDSGNERISGIEERGEETITEMNKEDVLTMAATAISRHAKVQRISPLPNSLRVIIACVMAYQEEVVFNIHNNKVFEFGLLSYVNGSLSKLFAFTYDSKVFTTGIDHMLVRINEQKRGLFFCLPNNPLKQGLKLIHTNNDVHTLLELASRNGSIDLFVAHKQQRLAQYHLKNIDLEGTYEEVMGLVEDDANLRCSSSSPFETRHPFHTRHKKKRNDSNQTWCGLNKKLMRGVSLERKVVVTKGQNSVRKGKQKSAGKGKQKVSEGESELGKKKNVVVPNYKRPMEKGKGIMVEDVVDVNKIKHVLPRPTVLSLERVVL
ncbi:hypothetical protein Tco_0303788 [Tanacetum coccineum]